MTDTPTEPIPTIGGLEHARALIARVDDGVDDPIAAQGRLLHAQAIAAVEQARATQIIALAAIYNTPGIHDGADREGIAATLTMTALDYAGIPE